MAELADALDLGSSGATRTCSSHASRTKMIFREYIVLSIFLSLVGAGSSRFGPKIGGS